MKILQPVNSIPAKGKKGGSDKLNSVMDACEALEVGQSLPVRVDQAEKRPLTSGLRARISRLSTQWLQLSVRKDTIYLTKLKHSTRADNRKQTRKRMDRLKGQR